MDDKICEKVLYHNAKPRVRAQRGVMYRDLTGLRPRREGSPLKISGFCNRIRNICCSNLAGKAQVEFVAYYNKVRIIG